MKKSLFLAIAISFTTSSIAQDVLEKTAEINLGLQGFDFSYELPISRNLIWESSAGLGVGMNVFGSEVQYNFALLQPSPSVATGLKWMYNFENRVTKKKAQLIILAIM